MKKNLTEIKRIFMITETTYSSWELEHGICKCCGEESDEILKGTGECLDCIEAENFYEETMKGLI